MSALTRTTVADELVGVAEVADLIGVERNTVTGYVAREQIVEPLARLRCGPVWLRRDIERWDARRPGKNGGG